MGGTAMAADAARPVPAPVAPAAAAPSLAGDLSIALGLFGYTDGGSSYGLFDAAARVNKPLGGTWNLEVQAASQAAFSGGDSEPLYTDVYGYLWTTGARHIWGVFGGASFGLGQTIGTVGLQAKHFTRQGSFGAYAAYNASNYYDFASFGVAGNFYFNPNHRIGVSAQVLTDFSETNWSVALDFEHRFQHPIGLWAAAKYTGYGNSYGLYQALVGLRFYLDGPGDTLQSHERLVPWFYELNLNLLPT
jgi:hypothetical protein